MPTISNIERFKTDLSTLLDQSDRLQLALVVKSVGLPEAKKLFKEQKVSEERLKNLPRFEVAYESWYSESLALIKQLLPDRLQDFREHFETPRNRKEITYATYRISDALNGLCVKRPFDGETLVDPKAAVPRFQQQIAIVQAARRRFESSLFEIRQLVQADLFDSEISSARELLKNKFVRAAGAVAGVVLEKHLQQVCSDHSLKTSRKNPGLSDLNQLLKDNGVIDTPQWRFISMLADIRNLCDHNKQQEATSQQLTDLLDGTDKILKTVF